MSETESKPKTAHQQETGGDCLSASCPPSLAEKIATALLTPCGGPECHRLQLMLRVDPGITTVSAPERNMGGHNKQSVIDTINRVLMDHGANAGAVATGLAAPRAGSPKRNNG